MSKNKSTRLPNVLMVGTGEYTTGYVHNAGSSSDKSAGVVALSLFDLRARGLVDALFMAGTDGRKFVGIRAHLDQAIGQRYAGLSTEFRSFPAEDQSGDPHAYVEALGQLQRGDIVTVFTPDASHHSIALAAIKHGCHVLVAKPLVHTVAQHRELVEAAEAAGVLCAMEVHKRWDPLYADARDRIRDLGACSFFSSYMSQPKSQLETFRSWAGKSSDISYYLNAHHVDFSCWALREIARPISVSAIASRGIAEQRGMPAEDTITLAVQWQDLHNPTQLGSALYTASWVAPKSDVHSQQRFHYMGAKGEVQIDQAHRGYSLATDAEGYSSPNPLFMKYTPDADAKFAGQAGYGYQSIAAFVDAARSVNAGDSDIDDWHGRLATARDTLMVTAILEAGRRSLDAGGSPIQIGYAPDGEPAAWS